MSVLEADEETGNARVRIEYRSPEARIRGAYEAEIEAAGSVTTLGKSGVDQPPQEVRQYRVTRLEKVS